MKQIALATALMMACTGSMALAGGYGAPDGEPSPVTGVETTTPDSPADTQDDLTGPAANRPARGSAATPCGSVFDRGTPACRS
ncbi:MAG: hypothetical protein AB7U46_10570 [Paenirhodobacter sp.]|uniref:hypothetical protein n=1 Tax=Paenirhodobacter sp. TaxID=1965326 RepID=UPI003D09A7EA